MLRSTTSYAALRVPIQRHSEYAICWFSESVTYPSPLSTFDLSQYGLLISQFQQGYVANSVRLEYSADDAQTFTDEGLQSV